MRILYLAHRIPYPPNKGDKLRAYHQLRHLAAAHEVHLCTLVDDPDDMQHVGTLRQLCAEVDAFPLPPLPARVRAFEALVQRRSFSPAFFGDPRAAARVHELLREQHWDAVMVFSSGAGGLLPDRLPQRDMVTLADFCDLDSAKWRALAARAGAPQRWLYGAEAVALERYELEFAARCAGVVFATPLEADDFATLSGQRTAAPVDVIANGVDHDYFAHPGTAVAAAPTLVFTGAMDYRPNFEGANEFIDTIWPRVRELHPDARLQIVGRQPPAGLRGRGSVPGVEVTGTVADIRPYLHGAWASIAPLAVARGVQNKVLEAMAAGLPTIISPAVARGLEAADGIETLVAPNPADWIDAISALLVDGDRRRTIGTAGNRYVTRTHHWDAHGRAWLELLDRSVAGDAVREAA